MRLISIIAALTLVLVAYQNCGSDTRTKGIFAQELSGSSVDEDCEEISCTRPEELLWLKIRESEPYRINLQNISGHFTVGGICGIGIYDNHSIIYEMKEAFGSQEIVAGGFLDNVCDLGHFQAAITPRSIQFNQKYILNLELVGLGDGNQPISNPMPSNKASLDVIFESGL